MLHGFDIARRRVVQHHQDEGHAHAACGLQFSQRHVQTAVAGQRDHPARPCGQLSAQGGGQAIADRRKAAVGDELSGGFLGVKKQATPVRGEAAVGDQDAILGQYLVDGAQQPRHVDR